MPAGDHLQRAGQRLPVITCGYRHTLLLPAVTATTCHLPAAYSKYLALPVTAWHCLSLPSPPGTTRHYRHYPSPSVTTCRGLRLPVLLPVRSGGVPASLAGPMRQGAAAYRLIGWAITRPHLLYSYTPVVTPTVPAPGPRLAWEMPCFPPSQKMRIPSRPHVLLLMVTPLCASVPCPGRVSFGPREPGWGEVDWEQVR